DKFCMHDASNAAGLASFSWGTAVRNFSGGINTTSRGAADSGVINSSARQISVSISLATLNAYLSSIGHPQMGPGSVLCGLRGNSFQTNSSGIVLEDYTRGGTEFTLPQMTKGK